MKNPKPQSRSKAEVKKQKPPSRPKVDIARSSRYHIRFALLAAKEAERVLPIFEKERPRDSRPRRAIEALRSWAKGERALTMKEVRQLSLACHAAARSAATTAATFAARSAGYAVATWHVPTHAMAAPIYAGKALLANKDHAIAKRKTRP